LSSESLLETREYWATLGVGTLYEELPVVGRIRGRQSRRPVDGIVVLGGPHIRAESHRGVTRNRPVGPDRAHPHLTRRGDHQMLVPADDVGVRAATPYPATDSPLAETRLTEVAFQWFSNSGT